MFVLCFTASIIYFSEKPPKQLSLTPLLPLSIDYKSAYEVFKQGWKTSGTIPVPEQIYQVKNSETTAAYHKYLQDQVNNDNDIIPQHFFFGGFLLCNLLESNTFCDFPECEICQNGFTDEINIKCLFSKSSTGHNFTHGVEEIGLRAQLICLMAHECSESPTETCEEAVVNNPHSVLVEFIVLYKKEGIDRLVN